MPFSLQFLAITEYHDYLQWILKILQEKFCNIALRRNLYQKSQRGKQFCHREILTNYFDNHACMN